MSADPTAAASSFADPHELVEETSAASLHEGSQEEGHSGSDFEWKESHPVSVAPSTAAPTTTTAAPPPTQTPKPTTPTPITNKSAANGGSNAVLSVTLVILGLLALLGVILLIRRRQRNKRFVAAKFQHDPNLGTPTVSIELPPPPPSSRFSAQSNQHRLSVFSNGRTGGGGSIFGSATPVVSPGNRGLQQPFRPDQSTTYRLVDPSPSNVATPSTIALNQTQAQTPAPQYAPPPQRQQHQPDYGVHKPQYTSAMTTSTSTVSSSFRSQGAPPKPRDSDVSVATTIQGLHDSMCDDLYKYGDGLNRERAASRGDERPRSRSRGTSSASATSRPKKPSIVLEIDEPLPALPPPTPSTPGNASKKTLSISSMAAKRAPPPPPPAQASSFFVIPPASPTLSETEPFNPLMMTSVRVHQSRASEDVEGNSLGPHAMTNFFTSSGGSAAASFGSVSSLVSPAPNTSSSSSSVVGNLQSTHTGHVVKPTDAHIQRLSDVSSISSETSTVRAGSLIELKQVVEIENPDGKAKEIEI